MSLKQVVAFLALALVNLAVVEAIGNGSNVAIALSKLSHPYVENSLMALALPS